MINPDSNADESIKSDHKGVTRRTALGAAATIALGIAAASDARAPAYAATVVYQHPFPKSTISDEFDTFEPWREEMGLGSHRGVDYAPGEGMSVGAVAAGTVVRSELQGGLGEVVVVRHADGVYSGYSHLGRGSRTVGVGASVARGQKLGVVGNTGSYTTGPHLHLTFSISSSDPSIGSVFDPVSYIDARISGSPEEDPDVPAFTTFQNTTPYTIRSYWQHFPWQNSPRQENWASGTGGTGLYDITLNLYLTSFFEGQKVEGRWVRRDAATGTDSPGYLFTLEGSPSGDVKVAYPTKIPIASSAYLFLELRALSGSPVVNVIGASIANFKTAV